MISLRILSFNGQENLSEITEEIMQSKSDSLSLLFPRNARIFKQKTDLQKLRNLCDSNAKDIIIVTQNSKARKEIEAMGIRTLPSLEYAESNQFEQLLDTQKETTSIENNEETEEHISDKEILTENKINSILEKVENKNKIVSSDDVKATLEKLNISHIPIDTRITKKTNTTQIQHKIISKPVLHAFFLLAGLALFLFGFIIKTVIPEANITITPSKKESEMHINANFLDKEIYPEPELWEEHNGVFMTPLHGNFQFSSRFTNVSKEFNGENAKGSIKIINTTNEDITLRETTKMQFNDNLIIRLPEWTKVPKQGNVIIEYTMPPKDIYGAIIGERGNKELGEKLTIPGLPENMQKEIYAQVHETFTGGKSVWKYKIQKNDFEKAKIYFKRKAIEFAQREADKLLEQEKKNSGKNTLRFLSPHYKSLQIEILEYKFAESEEEFQNLLSKEQGFIDAKMKVRIKIYTYDIEDIITLMELKYKNIAPDDMFLKSINKEILTSSIQNNLTEESTAKLSFSTRGIYEYSLQPKSDAEKIFIMNIKKEIISINKHEAQNILVNNFKEIATAKITLSPFWLQFLPELPEKINITIKHD